MNRRETVAALAMLGGWSSAGRAQAPARVARVGLLSLNAAAEPTYRDGGFVGGLRERGYAEGRNLVIERRDAEGKIDRLDRLAAELVARPVDLIVAPTTLAAQAAKRATATVPIVFVGAADPVSDGLVASLARPGANVTGLSNASADLVGKRLELLKRVLAQVRRVAVLWHPLEDGTHEYMLRAVEAAARSLDLRVQPVEARTADDVDRAFTQMKRDGAEAFTILPIATYYSERKRLIALAATHRLPAVYNARRYVEEGGLMAYGADLADLLRRAAGYVDRILRGARPSDLPIEQATKFELYVHLGTAKALGISIPRPVQLSADALIS